MQYCSISSALAMAILQSCTEPSMWPSKIFRTKCLMIINHDTSLTIVSSVAGWTWNIMPWSITGIIEDILHRCIYAPLGLIASSNDISEVVRLVLPIPRASSQTIIAVSTPLRALILLLIRIATMLKRKTAVKGTFHHYWQGLLIELPCGGSSWKGNVVMLAKFTSLTVPVLVPATKISSKWRHSRFSAIVAMARRKEGSAFPLLSTLPTNLGAYFDHTITGHKIPNNRTCVCFENTAILVFLGKRTRPCQYYSVVEHFRCGENPPISKKV